MEWDTFESWYIGCTQPKMEPLRVLGAIDSEDQPRIPTYALGKVIPRGDNLEIGLNLADYVDNRGRYDIVR